MDQAKPENQVIPWYQSERCIDTDLDSHVLLSAVVIHQISDEIPPFIAGVDQNDRLPCDHGTAVVDRYFVSQRTISQKGEGT